jgi:hypothetical protein
MNPLQNITRSAICGDALLTRSLVLDWLATSPRFSEVPKPQVENATELAVSAGLVELLADRFKQSAPAWAAEVGPAPEPTHLLRSAKTMPRLRKMCEAESPLPLKRRLVYVPANYLDLR